MRTVLISNHLIIISAARLGYSLICHHIISLLLIFNHLIILGKFPRAVDVPNGVNLFVSVCRMVHLKVSKRTRLVESASVERESIA